MLETSQIVQPQQSLIGPPTKSKRIRKRTETDRSRQREKSKTKYEKRRAAGLCAYGYCSEIAKAGHSQCQRHLQKMRDHALEARNERIAKGLCISCGERPQFWGRKCIICRPVRSSNPLPYGARRALRVYRENEKALKQEEERYAVIELIRSGEVSGDSARALRLHAGIEFCKRRSYREVGKIMEVSGERVRQLLLPAKLALHDRCGDISIENFSLDNNIESQSLDDDHACNENAPKVTKDGSHFFYKSCRLSNAALLGVGFRACQICRGIVIPSISDLDSALISNLIWKQGALTGDELRLLRILSTLTPATFAVRLGVGAHTLLSWEKLAELRYRDDLLVRVTTCSIHPDKGSVNIGKLIEVIRRRGKRTSRN